MWEEAQICDTLLADGQIILDLCMWIFRHAMKLGKVLSEDISWLKVTSSVVPVFLLK